MNLVHGKSLDVTSLIGLDGGDGFVWFELWNVLDRSVGVEVPAVVGTFDAICFGVDTALGERS